MRVLRYRDRGAEEGLPALLPDGAMKKTPLARKTPLKARTGLRRTKLKSIAKDRFATAEMKRRLYGLYKGMCYLCGGWFAYDDMVAEHVIPRGRGGQTNMDNLRIACRPDNALKGSMSLKTFRKKYGGPNAH